MCARACVCIRAANVIIKINGFYSKKTRIGVLLIKKIWIRNIDVCCIRILLFTICKNRYIRYALSALDIWISITSYEHPNILFYLVRFWAYRLTIKQTLKKSFQSIFTRGNLKYFLEFRWHLIVMGCSVNLCFITSIFL